MFKPLVMAVLTIASLCLAATAGAQTSTRLPGFTVYHNAVTADTLDPRVAATFGILRSKTRGVLNVSVIKDQAGAPGAPVQSLVEVDLIGPSGRRTGIPMREIEEAGAVSYLGEFPVQDGETLAFELRVRPAGVAEITTIPMSQEFFTQ
jgi:hypothetical protein